MPTSNIKFSDTIDKWVKETEARMLAVFRESTQRTVSRMQERIPIDTGFARASIRASTKEMPQIERSAKPSRGRYADEERGEVYPYDSGEIVLQINDAKLGETIFVGWTAAYVIYLEYGSSMQAPFGFVGITALEWPQIVDQVADEAKARAL